MSKFVGLLPVVSLMMLATTSPVFAAPAININKPYDWTVEIKTEEMPHQFRYHNSNLRPVIKTEFTYYHMEDESNKTKYQKIWYGNDKALGLERTHEFELTQGESIAIKVKHKDDSPGMEEKKAAARAVMRAVMDAQLNKNMVQEVKVPDESFNTITQTMQDYQLQEAPDNLGEEGIAVDLSLFVESESSTSKKTLCHYH